MGQIYILSAAFIITLLLQMVIFILKKVKNKPFDWLHAIFVLVFSITLAAAVWSADIITGQGFTTQINLENAHPIPLFEVEINYLTGNIYHFVPGETADIVTTLLLFTVVGAMFPLVWDKARKLYIAPIYIILLPVIIEVVCLLNVGYVLRTTFLVYRLLGLLIGFLIFKVVFSLVNKGKNPQYSVKNIRHSIWEPLCVVSLCLAVIILVGIPYVKKVHELEEINKGNVKIYLSPSKQPGNLYAVGDTNEEEQMVAVAKMVYNNLQKYKCEVMLADLTIGIGLSERSAEAAANNCDVYLAIHSNATGKAPTATGPVCFHYPDDEEGMTLGRNLIDELTECCPIESNQGWLIDGMKAFDGAGYGEVRNPHSVGIMGLIVEVNFHDNPITAQWIIDNKPVIADAITKALVETYDLEEKSRM